MKWGVGILVCVWVVASGVSAIEVLYNDILVNAASEKGGGLGGDLSMDGLFECVLVNSGQSAQDLEWSELPNRA